MTTVTAFDAIHFDGPLLTVMLTVIHQGLPEPRLPQARLTTNYYAKWSYAWDSLKSQFTLLAGRDGAATDDGRRDPLLIMLIGCHVDSIGSPPD